MQRQITDNCLFPTLPSELSLAIVELLDEADLCSVAQVCLYGSQLVNDLRMARETAYYQAVLKNSNLWRFIKLMAEAEEDAVTDALLFNYMQPMLGAIPVGHLSMMQNLSANLAQLELVAWLTENHSYEVISTCREKAKSILDAVSSFAQPAEGSEVTTPQSCSEFMIMPRADRSEWHKIWADLYKMDRAIVCLSLYARLLFSPVRPGSADVLVDPVFLRFLNGADVAALDAAFPGLFDDIINKALQIYRLPNKTDDQNNQLQAVEQLLGIVGAADFNKLVTQESMKEIIESNYLFLMKRLTEKLILEKINYSHPLAHAIFCNADSLKIFSTKGLIALLGYLPRGMPERIFTYPGLEPLLTFEILWGWLESGEEYRRSSKAKAILMHQPYLKKLEDNEILGFAKYLSFEHLRVFLNGEGFLQRLGSLSNPGSFIVKLASLNKWMFASKVAENKTISNMLTLEQVIEIAKAYFLSVKPFMENETLVDMLVEKDQLFRLLNECSHLDAKSAIETGCIAKLNNYRLADLLQNKIDSFDSDCIGPLMDEIKGRIETRPVPDIVILLERRISRTTKMEKEFWNKFELIRDRRRFKKQEPEPKSRLLSEEKMNGAVESIVILAPPPPPSPFIPPEEPPFIIAAPLQQEEVARFSTESSAINWRSVAKKLIWPIFAVLGIALIATGVGSALGAPLCTSALAVMFGWLPFSPLLTALLAGVLCLFAALRSGVANLISAQSEEEVSERRSESRHERISQFPGSTYGALRPQLNPSVNPPVSDFLSERDDEEASDKEKFSGSRHDGWDDLFGSPVRKKKAIVNPESSVAEQGMYSGSRL